MGVREWIDVHILRKHPEAVKVKSVYRKISDLIDQDFSKYNEQVFQEKLRLLEFISGKGADSLRQFVTRIIGIAYVGSLTEQRLKSSSGYKSLLRIKEIIDETEIDFVKEMISRYQRLLNNPKLIQRLHEREIYWKTKKEAGIAITHENCQKMMEQILHLLQDYLKEIEEMSRSITLTQGILTVGNLVNRSKRIFKEGPILELRDKNLHHIERSKQLYGIKDITNKAEIESKVFGDARKNMLSILRNNEATIIEEIAKTENAGIINSKFPDLMQRVLDMENSSSAQVSSVKMIQDKLSFLFKVETNLMAEREKAEFRQKGLLTRIAASGASKFALTGVGAAMALGMGSNVQAQVVQVAQSEVQQIASRIESKRQEEIMLSRSARNEKMQIYKRYVERSKAGASQNELRQIDESAKEKHDVSTFHLYKSWFYGTLLNEINKIQGQVTARDISVIRAAVQEKLSKLKKAKNHEGNDLYPRSDLGELEQEANKWIEELEKQISAAAPSAATPAPTPAIPGVPTPPPGMIEDTQVNEAVKDVKTPYGSIFVDDYQHTENWRKRHSGIKRNALKMSMQRIMRNILYYEALKKKGLDAKAERFLELAIRFVNKEGPVLFIEEVRTKEKIKQTIAAHGTFEKFLTQRVKKVMAEKINAAIAQSKQSFQEANDEGDVGKLHTAIVSLTDEAQICIAYLGGAHPEYGAVPDSDIGNEMKEWLKLASQKLINEAKPMKERLDQVAAVMTTIPDLRAPVKREFEKKNTDMKTVAKMMNLTEAETFIRKFFKAKEAIDKNPAIANYFKKQQELYSALVDYHWQQGTHKLESATKEFEKTKTAKPADKTLLENDIKEAIKQAERHYEVIKSAIETHKNYVEGLKEAIEKTKAKVGISEDKAKKALEHLEKAKQLSAHYKNLDASVELVAFFGDIPSTKKAAELEPQINEAKQLAISSINNINDTDKLNYLLKGDIPGKTGGYTLLLMVFTPGDPGSKPIGVTPTLTNAVTEVKAAIEKRISEISSTSAGVDVTVIQHEAEEAEKTALEKMKAGKTNFNKASGTSSRKRRLKLQKKSVSNYKIAAETLRKILIEKGSDLASINHPSSKPFSEVLNNMLGKATQEEAAMLFQYIAVLKDLSAKEKKSLSDSKAFKDNEAYVKTQYNFIKDILAKHGNNLTNKSEIERQMQAIVDYLSRSGYEIEPGAVAPPPGPAAPTTPKATAPPPASQAAPERIEEQENKALSELGINKDASAASARLSTGYVKSDIFGIYFNKKKVKKTAYEIRTEKQGKRSARGDKRNQLTQSINEKTAELQNFIDLITAIHAYKNLVGEGKKDSPEAKQLLQTAKELYSKVEFEYVGTDFSPETVFTDTAKAMFESAKEFDVRRGSGAQDSIDARKRWQNFLGFVERNDLNKAPFNLQTEIDAAEKRLRETKSEGESSEATVFIEQQKAIVAKAKGVGPKLAAYKQVVENINKDKNKDHELVKKYKAEVVKSLTGELENQVVQAVKLKDNSQAILILTNIVNTITGTNDGSFGAIDNWKSEPQLKSVYTKAVKELKNRIKTTLSESDAKFTELEKQINAEVKKGNTKPYLQEMRKLHLALSGDIVKLENENYSAEFKTEIKNGNALRDKIKSKIDETEKADTEAFQKEYEAFQKGYDLFIDENLGTFGNKGDIKTDLVETYTNLDKMAEKLNAAKVKLEEINKEYPGRIDESEIKNKNRAIDNALKTIQKFLSEQNKVLKQKASEFKAKAKVDTAKGHKANAEKLIKLLQEIKRAKAEVKVKKGAFTKIRTIKLTDHQVIKDLVKEIEGKIVLLYANNGKIYKGIKQKLQAAKDPKDYGNAYIALHNLRMGLENIRKSGALSDETKETLKKISDALKKELKLAAKKVTEPSAKSIADEYESNSF